MKLKNFIINHFRVFRVNVVRAYRRLFKDQHQLTSKTSIDRYPALFEESCKALGKHGEPVKLLSFGCSTGEECFSLKKYFPNARIVGADINTVNLAIAKRKNTDPDISFIYSTPKNLSKAAPYHAIFCLSVLCRWEDTKDLQNCAAIYPFAKFESAVKELAAMLIDGGLLVIYNSNFRFEETHVIKDFEIVHTSLTDSGFVHKFDARNNRVFDKHTHCIYRKIA